MPKRAKKAGARHNRPLVHQGAKSDFTLYDFAHVAPAEASDRMKKGSASSLIPEVKSMIGKSTESTESLAWYEKDLSDFDLSENEDNNNNEEEDGDDGEATVARADCRPAGSEKEEQGVVWPVDLWFMIGDYISPEDVSVFALICQGSHSVTHAANFWCSLYKRYFNPAVKPPKDLREGTMDRVHGLRQRVIRALFVMYPPFQTRLKCTPFENDPDIAIGARCVLMWYQKVKNIWHFYFKFYRPAQSTCSHIGSQGLYQPHSKRKRDYLMEASNIHHNPEENCCVLQVVTNNFISLPVIMGQFLVQVSVSVGFGMRYHKLKLVFNSENLSVKQKSSLLNATTIVLDPVANIKVVNWWDPKYPR